MTEYWRDILLITFIACIFFLAFFWRGYKYQKYCTASICNVAKTAGLADTLRYGHGTALVDVNNDGWDDIWASDEGVIPHVSKGVSRLYVNKHDGTFESLDPRGLGISDKDLEFGWTTAWADVNNDGKEDVLIVNGGYVSEGTLALYRNDSSDAGIKFTNISRASGITSDMRAWWGASWADYDQDGFADFVVIDRKGRPWLYHNSGNGTFTEVAQKLGITMLSNDAHTAVWFDYDNDGYPDLYVANYAGRQHLYHNNKGRSFMDVSHEILPYSQELFDDTVYTAAAADFDQDGYLDLYLGKQSQQDYILMNNGDGTFQARGPDIGLVKKVWPDKSENTMGLGIGDLDGNGFPDIFIGTGSPTQSFFDLIFCGKRETTTITSVSLYRCGDFTRQQGKTRTHGIAVGDVNNDGRADVYYSLGGPTGFDEEHAGPNSSRHYGALYINNKVNSSKGAVIHLRGTRSNPDAFGARITVRGSETHYYEVPSVQGYVSQNSAYIPITLGTSTQASVTVRWSPWHTETFTVRAGERRTVVESK